MGGREVGGLSNQLAAHMDFSDQERDRVQRYWRSPLIASKPGFKAVELFDAVADGKIKVIWIMATNPAVSLPNSNKVRQALELCPTVIVSDVTKTDTTDLATIILPAQEWSEKDGTVTNSERRISRRRGFETAPGLAKADWQMLCQVASKMGHREGFSFESPHQIFNEHAGLSAFENNGNRAFDISALQALTVDEYNDFSPVQWPVNSSASEGTKRLFADGLFFTEERTANFIVNKPRLADSVKQSQGFILNTGRVRDQWHTMTRTGHVS
jgi:assimilatory nitrate reductase catalytic subunit